MTIKFSQKHINEFKKIGVQTIYLFGSYVKGKYIHPLSDVDIGVVFEKPEKYKNDTMKPYSNLYDIIADVLPKSYLRRRFKLREHEFDIVFLQFVPISLQFEAIKDSKVLYENNREKRLNYEEYVIKRHCDLQYFYNLFDKCLLERI